MLPVFGVINQFNKRLDQLCSMLLGFKWKQIIFFGLKDYNLHNFTICPIADYIPYPKKMGYQQVMFIQLSTYYSKLSST